MIGPLKAGFCVVCCRRHFFDVACDPTDKRYTANARSHGVADFIEERRNPTPIEYQPTRLPPSPISERFSYAEEIVWNDPWWTP